jgi:hypothetical protein
MSDPRVTDLSDDNLKVFVCNKRVMVVMFNATFSNISVIYRGGQFY